MGKYSKARNTLEIQWTANGALLALAKADMIAETQLGLFTKADSWSFYGRNFTRPACAWIVVKDPTVAVSGPEHKHVAHHASEIFAAMKLDLNRLSQIFVTHPWEYYLIPKAQRPKQPTPPNYESLGCCRVWDEEGWIELARLLDKNLIFYHNHSNDPREAVLRCVYHHDGICSQINDTDV